MKKSQVTERIKSLMSDSDRHQVFGEPSSHLLHDSPHSNYDYETEKQEHIILENWLNQKELFYDHQRMDRRTTNKKGIPDFVIGIAGLMVCIEFKVHGRKLRAEQEEWRRKALEKSRVQYFVLDNADGAIRLLKRIDKSLDPTTGLQ